MDTVPGLPTAYSRAVLLAVGQYEHSRSTVFDTCGGRCVYGRPLAWVEFAFLLTSVGEVAAGGAECLFEAVAEADREVFWVDRAGGFVSE